MVSVIIPTYNRAATIGRAIDSVLQQTYTDIELIVVDDCSEDNTGEIVGKYNDDRLRFIKHEFNQGACAARNTGIEHARGEFIAFQDSDDCWLPDKLEIQLSLMDKIHADICFCSMHRYGYPADKPEYYPDLESGVVSYEKLLLKSLVSTQTILTKRTVAEEFKFDPEVKRMQDYDWIIRAAENNVVVFAKEAMVDVYLQDDSITTSDYGKLLETNLVFLNKYKYLFDRYPRFHVKLLDRIGFYKTELGMNASCEYREIYEIEKSVKSYCRWMASKMGLLKTVWRMRN